MLNLSKHLLFTRVLGNIELCLLTCFASALARGEAEETDWRWSNRKDVPWITRSLSSKK